MQTLPATCIHINSWTGNDTTRFGILGGEMPSSYGALYCIKESGSGFMIYTNFSSSSTTTTTYLCHYYTANSNPHVTNWIKFTLTT